MRRTGQVIALSVALLAIAPTGALAKHPQSVPAAVKQVWHDCANHNSLTHYYPLSVLEQAFADLPSDQKEYTPCANEIKNAEQQEIAGNRPTPSQTPAQQKQTAKTVHERLGQARKLGAAPVTLGGQKIAAGAVSVDGGSLFGDLPTPLLVLLIAIVALGSVPLGLRAYRIVRARRSR